MMSAAFRRMFSSCVLSSDPRVTLGQPQTFPHSAFFAACISYRPSQNRPIRSRGGVCGEKTRSKSGCLSCQPASIAATVKSDFDGKKW